MKLTAVLLADVCSSPCLGHACSTCIVASRIRSCADSASLAGWIDARTMAKRSASLTSVQMMPRFCRTKLRNASTAWTTPSVSRTAAAPFPSSTSRAMDVEEACRGNRFRRLLSQHTLRPARMRSTFKVS